MLLALLLCMSNLGRPPTRARQRPGPKNRARRFRKKATRSDRPSRSRNRHRANGPGPVIRLPAGRFIPPHCPNRNCEFYEPKPGWRYTYWGTYWPPCYRKPIPRLRCTHCRRTFTARTFSPTYWLHFVELFALIAKASVAGSGIRQIARTYGISHATVARHLSRAGRQCLAFHRKMIEAAVLQEDIVIDGFETFEYSQYFPCHYNLAVGKESWFIYHFTDSPLRRKGTMRPEQKRRREELEALLGRPDPKAVEKGILELLQVVLEMAGRERRWGGERVRRDEWCRGIDIGRDGVTDGAPEEVIEPLREIAFHSDDHPAYARALRRLQQEERLLASPSPKRIASTKRPALVELYPSPQGDEERAERGQELILRHVRTSSRAPRTPANNLFAVNLADLLLRHSEADHRRETVAFDKRRQGGLERAAIFTVWRNAVKCRREKCPGETAAMAAGILKRRLRWREVFSRRWFPRERELPGSWWQYYWRRVKTLALGERQTEHRAIYAF